MSCIEIKSDKYQNRKSPPFHAKDCKEMIKKGKDGNYKSQKDKNDIYKWIKINKIHKYNIHDNGSVPYIVHDDGKKIQIFKTDIKFKINVNNIPMEKYLDIKYKKIFVGKDNNNKNTGNSLLLQISKNKYIYVGSSIYMFQIDDTIISYKSPIGNSDVPYPYAIGTKYTYLMIEKVYIDNKVLEGSFPKYIDTNDPYAKYYFEFIIKDSKHQPLNRKYIDKDIRERHAYYMEIVKRIRSGTKKIKITKL